MVVSEFIAEGVDVLGAGVGGDVCEGGGDVEAGSLVDDISNGADDSALT
jgi:hypothetical protein